MIERKDIALTPQWPLIQFGDGTWGRVVEIKPSQNSEGVDTDVMKIIPGDLLIALHDIPQDMMDEQKHIKVEIPAVMIHNVSRNPAFPVYWCFVDIFGKTCPGTQFLTGYIEAEKMTGYQKMMDLKKAENAWLKEGYYKATTNSMKQMKEFATIADMFNINFPANQISNSPQVVGPVRSGE